MCTTAGTSRASNALPQRLLGEPPFSSVKGETLSFDWGAAQPREHMHALIISSFKLTNYFKSKSEYILAR